MEGALTVEQHELQKEYDRLFPPQMTFQEVSDQLKTMQGHPEIDGLRQIFCNLLLYIITTGYYRYSDINKLKKYSYSVVPLFLENAALMPKEKYYFHAVSAFFCDNQKRCVELLQTYAADWKEVVDGLMGEGDVVDLLIEPFKNAFPGFWPQMQELVSPQCKQDGTHELCQLMADYYACKTNEEAVDVLTAYIQKYPGITVAREYLACTYYDLKMWNNAIAYFESVQEPVLFALTKDQIHFMLAWAYGKIRDYKKEEENYRIALELFPDGEDTLNNLGYSLYRQKRCQEAKAIFERCLEEKRDLPYAANNYVRILIALGLNKQAKQFVKESGFKVAKNIKERVQKLPSRDIKPKQAEIISEESDEEIGSAAEEKTIDIGGKREQFSHERLLEDELTLRIESGLPVFGMNLKIYKRPGEYGRQYIIPIGRLDLLCEDERGDLYIVELKKDSGYGDVFQQIMEYLKWFETSKKFRDKQVQGIICLNNPTAKLIDQVHHEPRLKLFEYRISYQEI